MITQGRGAYIDPEDKPRIDVGELAMLQAMLKIPTVAHNRGEWAEIMGLPAHVISGHISTLKGLDLCKSSADDKMKTDDEITDTADAGKSVYWIGDEGQPINKRAHHTIEEGGILRRIIAGEYQFDFPLWPFRPERIVTMKALIVQQDLHRICLEFNIPEDKMVKLAKLTDQREVLVSIESM